MALQRGLGDAGWWRGRGHEGPNHSIRTTATRFSTMRWRRCCFRARRPRGAAVRAQVAVSRRVHVAVPRAARRDVDRLLALLLDGERDVEHCVVVWKLETKTLTHVGQSGTCKWQLVEKQQDLNFQGKESDDNSHESRWTTCG